MFSPIAVESKHKDPQPENMQIMRDLENSVFNEMSLSSPVPYVSGNSVKMEAEIF